MKKAVILAGGLGTRLSEETDVRPKPMVEIGGMPIIWHIMKIYSFYGINEFIICCGYKGIIIKEFFVNYSMHMSDITIDTQKNELLINNNIAEPWKVTLVNTGERTMTGGRLKYVSKYLQDHDEFCLTYGDGVANINIEYLLNFHQKHGKLATMTVVRPPARFGAVRCLEDGTVVSFEEKPQGEGNWINGGFFVLNKKVLDFIEGPNTVWEKEPLEKLVEIGELISFRHHEFWKPMDTFRDKIVLNELWDNNKAPWKTWE